MNVSLEFIWEEFCARYGNEYTEKITLLVILKLIQKGVLTFEDFDDAIRSDVLLALNENVVGGIE